MRFRVRSLERDDDADARRLSSIERPLSIAIAEAKSELEGLRRRLESARQRASVLVGDEPFSPATENQRTSNCYSRQKSI